MNFQKVPSLINSEDLQSSYAKVLKNAQDHGEPLFIISNSKPEAVFIDYGTWVKMSEEAAASRRGRRGRVPNAEKKK